MVDIEEWSRRPCIKGDEIAGGCFVVTRDGRFGVMKNSYLEGGDWGTCAPSIGVWFPGGANAMVSIDDLRIATSSEIKSALIDTRSGKEIYEEWASYHPEESEVTAPPMGEDRLSEIDDIWARASAESKAEMVKAIADALMTHVIVTEIRGDEREEIETFRMRNPTPVGDDITIARKEELLNGTRQTRCVTYKVIKSHGHMTQGYNGEWLEMVNLEVKSIEDELNDK